MNHIKDPTERFPENPDDEEATAQEIADYEMQRDNSIDQLADSEFTTIFPEFLGEMEDDQIECFHVCYLKDATHDACKLLFTEYRKYVAGLHAFRTGEE